MRAKSVPEWALEALDRLDTERDQDTGCLRVLNRRLGGYRNQHMYVSVRNRSFLVRRLVWLKHVGDLAHHQLVVNSCGCQDCIEPTHLVLTTRHRMMHEIRQRKWWSSRPRCSVG